jgi:flavin-dependent dehydrogenase
LGDSGCQVYAAHGSGIGMGLIAAKLLFDTIILARMQDLDIGALGSLIHYQQRFHKKYYQRLYFSEQFRRFSQGLSQVHINSMIKSGLLNSSMAKQTLRQDEPGLCFTSMRSLARGAFFAPRRFISMASVFKEAVAGKKMAMELSKKLIP